MSNRLTIGIKTIDREYAERMATSAGYHPQQQAHIHALANIALKYMEMVKKLLTSEYRDNE